MCIVKMYIFFMLLLILFVCFSMNSVIKGWNIGTYRIKITGRTGLTLLH